MKTLRRIGLVLAAVLALPPDTALAQQAGRIWRVGFLSGIHRPESLDGHYHGAFTNGLRELGYVDGKNLVIEWRYAEGDPHRLPSLAADLVRLGVDVIVTAEGTPSALAARNATSTIPIVFAAAGDPVGSGLVRSLAHPGGNATGNSQLLPDLCVKQMEALRQIVPRMTRLAVLWNPSNTSGLLPLNELQRAAPAAGVEVLPLEARNRNDIERAFRSMVEWRSQAFLWIVDSLLIQELQLISDFAAKHRLPSVGGLSEYADAGGLMSYGIKRTALYRRTAAYVDKILRGAKPGDLPMEQPTTIDLIVNRRTAKALGLTIPPELLLLADRVIE